MNLVKTRLALGALILVVQACDEPRPPRDDSGRPIKTLTVGAAESGWRREYPGTIGAVQEVELGFEVPGQITEFTVTPGTRVIKDDVIAKLDETNYRATLEAARAQLIAAEADVKRKRELFKIGGVAGVAKEEAERRFTAAQSDVKTSEKALKDAVLRAPFAGIVARTLVENFESVRQKQPVVTLQNPAWLEIKINVPEADAALAVPGLSLDERNRRIDPHVVASVLPSLQFPANITEFSTTADPVTRTYEVTLVFSQPSDVTVLPGMTARAVVEPKGVEDGATGVRIPVQTVAGDSSGEPYVWIIGADMKAARRPVKLGEMTGSMVQVVDGLKTGEKIALTGVHHLRQGLLVREWEAN